jgi:hypothetical protein
MIQISKKQIDSALPKVTVGLEKYLYLQSSYKNVNIAKDVDWQTRFNGFYKIRRNKEWRDKYYLFFENHKIIGVSFSQALKEIFKQTGRIEASFSSKLVATIHPEKPIIDKFVLKNTGLHLPYYSAQNKLQKIVEIYQELENKYHEFLESENGKYLVEKFKNKYPKIELTNLKMVDLILWQTR